MMTKTALIARAVVAMTGKGTSIFNDRLADGRRSLKVWGWTEMEYGRAQAMLTEARCSTTLQKLTDRNGYTTIRLYVYE